MAGGLAAQLLSSLNYSDTTMCSLPVLAASQEDLEAQRQACIECVRERLKQPLSALTIFPRFQGHEVRTVNIQPTATKGPPDGQAPRNDKARSSSDDSSSSSSSSSDDDEATMQVPLATVEMLRGIQLLRGNTLPAVAPRPASQRELTSFMQLVALTTKRECGVTLSGCPPAQNAHTQADDFRRDEQCVAAVHQLSPLPLGTASFTLERVCCTPLRDTFAWLTTVVQAHSFLLNANPVPHSQCSVMARWPGTTSALLVQLLDRPCPKSTSPPTAICCVIAACYLYKLNKQ